MGRAGSGPESTLIFCKKTMWRREGYCKNKKAPGLISNLCTYYIFDLNARIYVIIIIIRSVTTI